jgi:hypothetical protein
MIDHITLSVSSKLYHARNVTGADVRFADEKDIPRIFQLFYAGEGETTRRPSSSSSTTAIDRLSIDGGGHDLTLNASRGSGVDVRQNCSGYC